MEVRQGQSLVEILLAIALAALMLPAVFAGLMTSWDGRVQQQQRVFAVSWANEGVEAVRNIAEAGWAGVSTNGSYYPVVSGGKWTLETGTEVVDGFTRGVEIDDVYRDQIGAIVESGTVDPSSKKVVVTVSWQTPLPASVVSESLVTRYRENLSYSQTSKADFETGVLTEVAVTNTSGGEVVLGAGGSGSWCEPNLTISAFDLPKNGVANAVTAIEGRVFAGTGDNASGVSLANVNIANTNPPGANMLGTFDGYKTNGGVFGESNYAYLATDTNSEEVVIVQLTTQPYTKVGYFDSPGSTDSNSVFISGQTGYMTAGNKLYNFDLTSKSGSRPKIDSDGLTLAGVGSRVYVVGEYAYVAVAGSSYEMQIVSLANPTSLQVVGQVEVDPSNKYSGENGQDVYVNSSATRAYLVINQSTSAIPQLYIVDISTKSGNRPLVGSYGTNLMAPRGLTVVPGNKVIVVGHGGMEYQVVDITNEAAPVGCGGLNIDSGVNGVASVVEGDGDAYSYIITGDATSELKIIEGGPGGQYSAAGTYESTTFDPGFDTVFNRLSANMIVPNQTEIKFQVAIAQAVSGSCSGVSFVFVGPDKSTSSYFTQVNNVLPFGMGANFNNPGRCFRYRAILSSMDAFSTPILNDVTINYSP